MNVFFEATILGEILLISGMPLVGGQGRFSPTQSYYNSKGADYAHRITACPPRFENLTASLYLVISMFECQLLDFNYFSQVIKHTMSFENWFHVVLNSCYSIFSTIDDLLMR